MAVLSVLHEGIRESILRLDAELSGCENVQGKMRSTVREFLIEKGIYSIEYITDKVKLDFGEYLNRKEGFSERQKLYYVSALEMLQLHYYAPLYKELLKEIEKDIEPTASLRKAETYLLSHGIYATQDIDFELRSAYEIYLTQFIAASKINEYLKVLDLIKLNAIKRECEKFPFRNRKLSFSEKKIFLLYHPDYKLAMSFYYLRDKEELLFDFTLPAPIKMKRQVFGMLNHILINITNRHDRRERFLVPLKLLYQFCREQNIEDLERFEEHHIEAFKECLIAVGNTLHDSYIQILDNIRKFLFLDAPETNWEANVWYLERFHLQSHRMNPSNPVLRIPFYQVHNPENRKYLQYYMQYLIGVTDMSLAQIRAQLYRISEFLRDCDNRNLFVLEVTPQDMDQYLKHIDEGIQADTFNGKAVDIYRFFRFLITRGYLDKIPFVLEYYLKEVFPVHHDRAVEEAVVSQMLANLHLFPEHLRLMYLHLWSLGLRANEVCMIRGDAYYQRKGDTWIKLYQNKMKAEKTIPIPAMLYQLMKIYIQEKQIMPDEYVFQNAKGGAFDVNTFAKQMIKHCEELGIRCSEYTFRSHDYRHTVATSLYAHGASIQAIRDYMGHKSEDMTKQYIDYMPEKIDKANDEYFSVKANSIARKMKKGGQHEK